MKNLGKRDGGGVKAQMLQFLFKIKVIILENTISDSL